MFSPNRFARGFLALLAAPAALALSSCGTDDGLGKRFPVSGAVTYNGQPLEKGNISFVPEDPKGVGATGIIEKGAYTLSLGGDNDGARAGKYKVVITATEDPAAKAKADFDKARAARKNVAGTEEITVLPKQFAVKAAAEAKSLIPVGYGNPQSTNLTAEVLEKSNPIDFKLTDAEAPAPAKAAPTSRGRRKK